MGAKPVPVSALVTWVIGRDGRRRSDPIEGAGRRRSSSPAGSDRNYRSSKRSAKRRSAERWGRARRAVSPRLNTARRHSRRRSMIRAVHAVDWRDFGQFAANVDVDIGFAEVCNIVDTLQARTNCAWLGSLRRRVIVLRLTADRSELSLTQRHRLTSAQFDERIFFVAVATTPGGISIGRNGVLTSPRVPPRARSAS